MLLHASGKIERLFVADGDSRQAEGRGGMFSFSSLGHLTSRSNCLHFVIFIRFVLKQKEGSKIERVLTNCFPFLSGEQTGLENAAL